MTATFAQDVIAARDDVAVFASMVGWPLTDTQAAALRLETRSTVLVAPRQTGKSYSLAVLATWAAFRAPGVQVLIVSAGEEASRRLLGQVRAVCAHPLLADSVLDESASLVQLANGSEIRSVPASERQIRGWSVDLLIVDEAALVSDEVLYSAALPTTAARPDARVVLASTPQVREGGFYAHYVQGLTGADPHVRTYQWSLRDAPWVSPEAVAHARATMPTMRFNAEYLCEFMSASDSYFDRQAILDAVAPYRLIPPAEASGGTVVVGLDWGRVYDSHAIVLVAQLDDHGLNPEPVYYLPWVEASDRSWSDQVETVAAIQGRPQLERSWRSRDTYVDLDGYQHGRFVDLLPGGMVLHSDARTIAPQGRKGGYEVAQVVTELNGVGAMPSEVLGQRMPGTRVTGVHSSQQSKEDAYGRLQLLLDRRQLVLPDHGDLVRQLIGMRCVPTRNGHLTIEAASPSVHDDLPDALSLAVSVLPTRPLRQLAADVQSGDYVETPSGIVVPNPPRPVRGGMRLTNNRTTSY